MSQLLQIRKNITYGKKDSKDEELIPIHEIILVVDKPQYTRTNEGDIIRERGCEQLRFTIEGDEAYDKFIAIFIAYKESKPEDLK
jgi:hypothetical protein